MNIIHILMTGYIATIDMSTRVDDAPEQRELLRI
jgi:hypothetical protein